MANPTNGQFRIFVPEGDYTVRCHEEDHEATFLPAGSYTLDLRPGRGLDFEISKVPSKAGEVRIRLPAKGDGIHCFTVRTDNLSVKDGQKELTLKPGRVESLE